MDYQPRLDDIGRLLFQTLQAPQQLQSLAPYAETDADLMQQVLDEAGKFVASEIAPLQRVGDETGAHFEAGRVTMPPGFRAAYQAFWQAGWPALACAPEDGGQGLPAVLEAVLYEMLTAANHGWTMAPGLLHGAYECLKHHGSDELKARYLEKIATGEWLATMCLTEAHAGSDLGLVRTKALPQADGSYRISGGKIFISGGEHDLTDNIVHLVLARLPDAPPGPRGLSLFLAPKLLPDGARNGVHCERIEEKMGLHGSPTCVLRFEDATGWLVGEPGKGLNAMFVMMNEARLAVGIQGLGQSEVAYQNAVAYAKDRLQGRSLTGAKAPDKAADPIIVHPDVRRTLMTIRAFNEAGRALILWTALQADIGHRSDDAAQRQAAEDHMGLMTPVVKGVLTDKGFDNAVAAQQMFGGHGYIEEWGMSQFVRDARIAMIYEGANGIQAMDLIGRKLPKDGGRAMMAFLGEVQTFIKDHGEDEALKPFTAPLQAGLNDLQAATMWFMQNAFSKPDNAGAGATDYMHLLGLVAMGYMWARIAKAAIVRKAEGNGVAERMDGKLVTGRFYMERMLPETAMRLTRIKVGAETTMALPVEAF